MKPGVGDGIAIIERSDKVRLDGFVRIERIDEGLSRRQQHKNKKQQEGGNEEEDLAASSHSVFDEIPNPKLQTPKKSQGPNPNECFRSRTWSLVFGPSLVFGVWCLELFTVPFSPGSLSPLSSTLPPVSGPSGRSEFFRTSRKTPPLAPVGNRCPAA